MTRNRKSKITPAASNVPLHRRVLGRGAVEMDVIDDLRLELEQALRLDTIEYDVYLDCCEALDLREQKARIALDKATGRYIKPDKVVPIKVKVESRREPEPWKPWQVKLFFVVALLILLKIYSLGG